MYKPALGGDSAKTTNELANICSVRSTLCHRHSVLLACAALKVNSLGNVTQLVNSGQNKPNKQNFVDDKARNAITC